MLWGWELLVIQVVVFVGGLAGEVDAQLAEDTFVHRGQENRGVELTALELFQLRHSSAGIEVTACTDGQGDKNLVGVETGIHALHVIHLQGLDGLDGGAGDQVSIILDAGQLLQLVSDVGLLPALALDTEVAETGGGAAVRSSPGPAAIPPQRLST